MRFLLIILAIVAGLAVIAFLAREPIMREMGRRTLATEPNGPETPASVGVPFERVAIDSAGHKLDGYLVIADAKCADAPAILVFHGLGETISRWVPAQRILYSACVSSLVFDYTGTGNSTGEASFEAVNDDIAAAYAFARARFGQARLYLLGHSMGNAPLLAMTPKLSPQPDGIVLGNAFSSLRSSMQRSGYDWLTWTMPDVWDNAHAVRDVHVPVLVVASDGDKVNPLAEGQALFAAANEPKSLSILHGLRHNALHRDPSGAWWVPVIAFVKAPVPAR